MQSDVTLSTPDGEQPAVLNSEHEASTAGLPVLLLEGEPVKPKQLPAGSMVLVPHDGTLFNELAAMKLHSAAVVAGYPARLVGQEPPGTGGASVARHHK